MLKEVAAEVVLQHKLKTRERGSGWLAVANKLKVNIPAVDITGRSIRDHFGMLARKHRINMAKQEKDTRYVYLCTCKGRPASSRRYTIPPFHYRQYLVSRQLVRRFVSISTTMANHFYQTATPCDTPLRPKFPNQNLQISNVEKAA